MNTKRIGLLALAALSITSCNKHTVPATPSAPPVAKATISAKSNSQVGGEVLFFQSSKNTVLIQGTITGLKPNSQHGFHVHEKGDCSAVDGSSAGGHFNPNETLHGPTDSHHSHAGDLGNISTNDLGIAHFSIVKKNIQLTDSPSSYVGKSLIIHDKEDDLKTQPTGNAGSRIGCGVIVPNA